MNEKTRYISKAAICVAISSLALVIATNVSFMVTDFLCVSVSAFATVCLLCEEKTQIKWVFLIYLGTCLLTIALGGVARPVSLLVYAIVIAPYFGFHYWIERKKLFYFTKFGLKAVVMTGVCLLFFAVLSPILPSVYLVLDFLAKLPVKWFGVNWWFGVFISMTVCASIGVMSIPICDFVLNGIKKGYLKIVK